ncbi:MAG: helix-turn-helix domain-containing protein [Candidatus Flexifilum sp.]|jgi:DNA-binding transcriptional ArsR family regulator
MKRFDLLNHPVRLRIVQLLYGRQLTTTQIAGVLQDVPRPSLYRHISKLLQGGVIEVVATHLVKGIEERTLTAVKAELHLSDADLARGIDTDEFADFVRIYGTLAANEMAALVASSPHLDVDRLLFRDYEIALTDEEFAELRRALWALLDAAEKHPPTADRRLRRVLVLSYPLSITAAQEGDTADDRTDTP